MKKYSKTFILGILMVNFLFGINFSSEAAINTDVALTPGKGELIFRSQVRVLQKSGDPSDKDREVTVIANPNVLVYGIRDDTAIFGIIPYLDKELKTDDASGNRIERGDSGLGDIRLFLKHRFWKRDAPGATTRTAILGGIEFPTGEDEEKDSRGTLPAPLQLGSGSWDPFIGGVFTHQQHRYEFTQDVIYKFNTEANDFEFGDELFHDTGLWYRIWPWRLPEWGTPSAIHAVIEANGIWEQKAKKNGTKVDDSGGYTLFLSPGIQHVTVHTIVEFSVQLPVIQKLNGKNLEADWVAVVGFRFRY